MLRTRTPVCRNAATFVSPDAETIRESKLASAALGSQRQKMKKSPEGAP
jgi:hypothetical protein